MPDPANLHAAMLARASDLAHYMHERGMNVEVVVGTTHSGLPCAIILAVGSDAAGRLAQVGDALRRGHDEQREADARQAERN